jgi:cytochrome c-type biogenesis protein CcmH
VTHRVMCMLIVLLAAAFAASGAMADSLDDQARQIAREVQCPVCQGLSVADSPSQLASQMRGIIRSKLEAGETREAILTYFADRYGESVLLAPPRSGPALLIWLAPYVGAAGILALVFLMIKRRWPSPSPAAEPNDPALDPYLEEVDRAAEAMRSQPLR